jgi:transposase-like protein
VQLTDDYPYLILDARYGKVREEGVIQSQAVLIAIGINWERKREVLGVEFANRESQTSWREFLMSLKQLGSTLTFYRLPRLHHRHLKSTNMIERLNEELRRCSIRGDRPRLARFVNVRGTPYA